MITVLLIIAVSVELLIIRFLYNEKNYWKQVAKERKELMNKWWKNEG